MGPMIRPQAPLLVALCALPTLAQTGDCTIQVVAPPGIRIFVDEELKGVTAKAEGGLVIEGIEAGTHRLRAVRERYRPIEKEVTLLAGQVYPWTLAPLVPKLKISESGDAGARVHG